MSITCHIAGDDICGIEEERTIMSDISPTFDELWSFDERLSSNQVYLLVSHEDANGSIRSCKISLDSLAS